MKRPFYLTGILLLVAINAFCQDATWFSRYDIGSTGAKTYMPKKEEFKVDDSPDGSKVYTAEVLYKNIYYDIIFVKLKDPVNGTSSELVGLLTSYLDFFKKQFEITSSEGYTKGFNLNGNSGIYGVTDNWKDKESNKWKIGGWVNSKYIAIIFNYSVNEPSQADFDYIRNGFVFPSY